MGGMQRVSRQLADALGHRPDTDLIPIVLKSDWESIAWNTTRFMTRLLVELPVMVRDHRADVVLFSSMVTASLAVPLRRRLGVPVAAIVHGQDATTPHPVYQWWVRRVFGALDQVLCVSRATRQACIDRGADPAATFALGNGFVPDPHLHGVDRSPARGRLLEMLGAAAGDHLLLTVGRLMKRKGHAWFVANALPLMPPDTRYVVVGEGPERAAVETAAREAGLADRVHVLGRQPDAVLADCYAGADVFVMPNIGVPGDMEGFGVVLLEANAAGLPAVAAGIEGILDVVSEGENGLLVPSGDGPAFAGAVARLRAGDRAAWAARVATHVHDRFTWAAVAQRYRDHLALVVDTKA